MRTQYVSQKSTFYHNSRMRENSLEAFKHFRIGKTIKYSSADARWHIDLNNADPWIRLQPVWLNPACGGNFL